MGEKLAILFIGTKQDANLLRRLIRNTDYQGSPLYEVNSLAEANLIRKYDLIITDFAEGIETLSSIKQAYPNLAILYFGDDDILADRAVMMGAQDYIPKNEIDSNTFQRIITFSMEREEHTSKLKEKIFTDELTGLYNRRAFIALLKQQMELTKRSNQGFMLFMFDLDLFKQINDRYGHLAGDDALIQTATMLRKAFRSHDIIARLGGDEFAVIALNSRPEGKELFKRHLLLRLKEFNEGARPYQISCSIGSTYYAGNHHTVKDLVAEADKDLYREKKKRHDYLLEGREERI